MTAGSRIVIAFIVLAFIATGLYYLVVSGEDSQSPSVAPAVSEPAPVIEPEPAPAPPIITQAPVVAEPVATETVAFRVTVPSSAPAGIDLDRERKTLAVSGPLALPGAQAGWYPVNDLTTLTVSGSEDVALTVDPIGYLRDRFGLVAAIHNEALYILLYSNAGQSLAPARRRGVDVLSAELATSDSEPSAVNVTLGSDTRERLKMLVNRNAGRTWAVLIDSVVVEFTRLEPTELATLSMGQGLPEPQLERMREAIIGAESLPPARFVAAPVAPSEQPSSKGTEEPLLAASPVLATPAPSAPSAPSPAPTASNTSGTTYRILPGDTLSSIAAGWFGKEHDWPRIVAANPGLDPNRLKIGQSITLPPKASASTPSGGRGVAAPAPASSGSARPRGGASYQVRTGDSLSRISQEAYGSANYWNVIYQANRSVIGANPADLSVGMTLVIPKAPR